MRRRENSGDWARDRLYGWGCSRNSDPANAAGACGEGRSRQWSQSAELRIDLEGVDTVVLEKVEIRSKRIGDFVAGTVVVKERATEAPSLSEIIKVSEIEQQRMERTTPAPFLADTRLLSEQELRAVETFLKRRFELKEPNRTALAARIAQPISIKLGIATDGLGPESLLEEVDRQHRAQSRYFD